MAPWRGPADATRLPPRGREAAASATYRPRMAARTLARCGIALVLTVAPPGALVARADAHARDPREAASGLVARMPRPKGCTFASSAVASSLAGSCYGTKAVGTITNAGGSRHVVTP
jgi:hypothetical protein